jgi:hypothetical protein
LAFFVLQDHPDILHSLTEHITKAIAQTTSHATHGCLTLALCGAALLSRYNTLLAALDAALAHLDMSAVCATILDLFEVFCRYFKVDLRDSRNLEALAETTKQSIKGTQQLLKVYFLLL